jgi:hypothetical protein
VVPLPWYNCDGGLLCVREKDVYVYLTENGKWRNGKRRGGKERSGWFPSESFTANMRESWVFLCRLIDFKTMIFQFQT